MQMRCEPLSDCIEKTFHKCPQLAVSSGPLSSSMRSDSLIEVSKRHIELLLPQEHVNFVIGLREVKCLRKDWAKLTILDRVSVTLQCADPSRYYEPLFVTLLV